MTIRVSLNLVEEGSVPFQGRLHELTWGFPTHGHAVIRQRSMPSDHPVPAGFPIAVSSRRRDRSERLTTATS